MKLHTIILACVLPTFVFAVDTNATNTVSDKIETVRQAAEIYKQAVTSETEKLRSDIEVIKTKMRAKEIDPKTGSTQIADLIQTHRERVESARREFENRQTAIEAAKMDKLRVKEITPVVSK